MKNLYLLLLIVVSCQNKNSIDLSQINTINDINKTIKKLGISNSKTQDGSWELIKEEGKIRVELQKNGNISTIYNLMDLKDEENFYFGEFKIEKGTGGKIVENNNKIAFVEIALEKDKTFIFLKILKKKFGIPDQIIEDQIYYDLKNDKIRLLEKQFDSNEIRKIKDEFDDEYLIYPLHYIWEKEGFIYKYTVFTNEISFSNNLVIISQEAFKNKIIFGYHNPENDPIFKKYYNE